MMITAPQLELNGFRHGFFTREGGRSSGLYASLNCGLGSGDDRAAVTENRALVAGLLGVPAGNLLTVHQYHSSDVVTVTAPWSFDERPKADAMVTNVPGIAIGVLTADCGPILFADPRARVAGAAHAGWKGAIGGVIEATLAAMERLGASRGHVAAALGPTISQSAYEVGPEFIARFEETDRRNSAFFVPSPRRGHAMFDLPGYIRLRLESAGVTLIGAIPACTCGEETRFYSYRRATLRGERDYGRQISAIALS
jgi:hypothetical protein